MKESILGECHIELVLSRYDFSNGCISFMSFDVVDAMNLVMVLGMLVCLTNVYPQCQMPCPCQML